MSLAISLRRRVTWRQIELLAAFAHAPNLSSAARAVHLTQPAASRLLATLAADLGVQIFERAGRSLRPTVVGRALVRRSASLVGSLDRTQAELAAIREGLAGSLTVGAGVGACYALLPGALAMLLEKVPQVSVRLRDGPMDEHLAMLRDGRLDLVVGRVEPSAIGQEEVAEELYDPQMRIVCGVRHPLAHRVRVSWPALLSHEWILPDNGTPMRTAIERLFRRAADRPAKCHVESSSIPANVALLAHRNMLWPLSSDIADGYARVGLLRVLPVANLSGSGAVCIIQQQERVLLPAAVQFIECLRATARRLALANR